MNIFVLDMDAKKCAEYHCARHTSKMVSEYCQIMSTVIYETTGHLVSSNNSDDYKRHYPKSMNNTIKPTHRHHPCVKWCIESMDNFLWLLELTHALHDEWIYKFNHKQSDIHGTYYKFLEGYIDPRLASVGMTDFALAMPDEYKVDDVVQSYRNYYNGDKRHLFNWKNRDIPYWIEGE